MINPMLSGKASIQDVKFPCWASPKFDGVRAMVQGGIVLSRNLKPIPNALVQTLFGLSTFEGLDGELIVGDPTHKDVYRSTMSGVMSQEGAPDVKLYVFDCFTNLDVPFINRLERTRRISRGSKILQFVEHERINNEEELAAYEAQCLAEGYEGIMVRDPFGTYKQGRSTAKEGGLLKIKRFLDAEAEIIGFTELMTNTNVAVRSKTGHLERSHKKAGMKGKGILGAFKVLDLKTKVEFEIGTGFTQEERETFWQTREKLLGRLVKYKYFPTGSRDRPRFPVYLGFRSKLDM